MHYSLNTDDAANWAVVGAIGEADAEEKANTAPSSASSVNSDACIQPKAEMAVCKPGRIPHPVVVMHHANLSVQSSYASAFARAKPSYRSAFAGVRPRQRNGRLAVMPMSTLRHQRSPMAGAHMSRPRNRLSRATQRMGGTRLHVRTPLFNQSNPIGIADLMEQLTIANDAGVERRRLQIERSNSCPVYVTHSSDVSSREAGHRVGPTCRFDSCNIAANGHINITKRLHGDRYLPYTRKHLSAEATEDKVPSIGSGGTRCSPA